MCYQKYCGVTSNKLIAGFGDAYSPDKLLDIQSSRVASVLSSSECGALCDQKHCGVSLKSIIDGFGVVLIVFLYATLRKVVSYI